MRAAQAAAHNRGSQGGGVGGGRDGGRGGGTVRFRESAAPGGGASRSGDAFVGGSHLSKGAVGDKKLMI